MQNKIFSALLLMLWGAVGLSAVAQPERKAYAAPKLTQAVRDIRALRTPFRPSAADEVALPLSVDNSKAIYFPPILDQQGGSCAQASGIGYMFTYELNRLLGRNANASTANRMSYQFVWNLINEGEDQGGFVEQGLYIGQRYGIMSVEDFGSSYYYTFFPWASGYDKYLRAMHNRTRQILTFEDSIPLIKRYLYDAGDGSATGGVVTFSTQSRGWTINNDYDGPSETGYHSLLTKLATEGAHALTIAGYDDLVTYTDERGITHTGAFIVVNSWGSYYHDNGRFYLPYDFFRDSSVPSSQLSDNLHGVRVMQYEPQVVFRVELSYDSRNDLSFGMAATADRDRERPATAFQYSYAFNNQGGDFPMRGQFRQKDIELALDFTGYNLKEGPVAQYFLNVRRQARGKLGSGQVTAVEVIDYRSGQPKVYPYRGELPRTLAAGENIFSVPLAFRYAYTTSAFRYLSDDQTERDASTYQVRTASGRYGKMEVAAYNAEQGTVTLHYVVNKH